MMANGDGLGRTRPSNQHQPKRQFGFPSFMVYDRKQQFTTNRISLNKNSCSFNSSESENLKSESFFLFPVVMHWIL